MYRNEGTRKNTTRKGPNRKILKRQPGPVEGWVEKLPASTIRVGESLPEALGCVTFLYSSLTDTGICLSLLSKLQLSNYYEGD